MPKPKTPKKNPADVAAARDRKKAFRLALVIRDMTAAAFAASLEPPITPQSLSQVLGGASSERVVTAIDAFIAETKRHAARRVTVLT